MFQKTLKVLAGLSALAVLGFAATTTAGDTVNDKCPISQKAVDGSTTSKVGDSEVGFCCGRCKTAFDGWEDTKKATFVSRAEGQDAAKTKAAASPAGGAKLASAPYLLDICPVSGEKLGSMGDPIAADIEGRAVKFCCEGCVGKYKESPAKFAGRIDKAMADQQRPYYALTTCVVSDEPLGDEPSEIIVGNRLVKTCCGMCAKKVAKSPADAVAKVERANAAAQTKLYPLKTCAVSGEELGSMGDPIEQVVGGRLVKLCCKGCVKGLKKNPAKIVAAVDAAWAPIHAREAAAKK